VPNNVAASAAAEDTVCLSLGKAEWSFEPASISYQAVPGSILLLSTGLAILGREQTDAGIKTHAWTIRGGERVHIDRSAPSVGAWAVGIMNSASVVQTFFDFPVK